MTVYVSRHAEKYINDKRYKPERVIEAAKEFLPDVPPKHTNFMGNSLRHLAHHLRVDPSVISNVVRKKGGFPPYLIIALLEFTGWTMDEFKHLSGVKTFMRY